MIAALLLAQAATEAPSSVAASQPIVIQSLCVPQDASNAANGFIFELIQTDGKWSNRFAPVDGSEWPVKAFEVLSPRVNVLPAPKGERAVMNTGSVEIEGARYSYVAIARIPDQQISNFSVSLTKVVPGKENDPAARSTVSTECRFTEKSQSEKGGHQ